MTLTILLLTLAFVVSSSPSARRRPSRPPPRVRPTEPALWLTGLSPAHGRSRARWSAAISAVALLVLVPTPVGVALAALVAFAFPAVVERLDTKAAARIARDRAHDLPLVLDLLAAAWRSGVPTLRAVECVASAAPPALQRDLEMVASRLALGVDPEQAWAGLQWGRDASGALDALIAAGRTGASPTASLRRSAQQAREARRRRGEAAARRVAVRVAAPLGLCFLPAFVLLAIVPAVLGSLGPVLA
jgi:pilus assembly protein TadC